MIVFVLRPNITPHSKISRIFQDSRACLKNGYKLNLKKKTMRLKCKVEVEGLLTLHSIEEVLHE